MNAAAARLRKYLKQGDASRALHWHGVAVLLPVTFCFVLTHLALLVGLTIGNAVSSVCLLAVVIGSAFAIYVSPDRRGTAVSLVVALVATIVLLAGIEDKSGDHYYHETVQYLAGGWNPVFDARAETIHTFESRITSFPKGPLITATPLPVLTGRILDARWPNVFLLVAGALISVGILTSICAWPRRLVWLVALGLSSNSIVVSQLSSLYVDGQLALVIQLVVLFLAKRLSAGSLSSLEKVTFAFILAYGLVIKHSSGPYLFVLVAGAIFIAGRIRKPVTRAELKGTILAGLISAVLFGLNPYVSNTIIYGSPLYPMLAPNMHYSYEDNGQVPNDLLKKSRVGRFVLSTLAETHVFPDTVRIKLPFEVHGRELRYLNSTDNRVGGFGPLFSGLLLASLVSITILGMRKRLSLPLLGLTAVVLVSVFINPEPWWSRFVPQLWLVTFIPLIGVELKGHKDFARLRNEWLISVPAVIAIANASLYLAIQCFAPAS